MGSARGEPSTSFEELKPGDRIQVEHTVHVGGRTWHMKTVGTVVRTERRGHGLHFERAADEPAYSDVILLELSDGELTTVAMDEFTILRRPE